MSLEWTPTADCRSQTPCRSKSKSADGVRIESPHDAITGRKAYTDLKWRVTLSSERDQTGNYSVAAEASYIQIVTTYNGTLYRNIALLFEYSDNLSLYPSPSPLSLVSRGQSLITSYIINIVTALAFPFGDDPCPPCFPYDQAPKTSLTPSASSGVTARSNRSFARSKVPGSMPASKTRSSSA